MLKMYFCAISIQDEFLLTFRLACSLMLLLVWRKGSEEDSKENPKQAVGTGEPQEKEGIYRWTGGQVNTHYTFIRYFIH